MTALAVADRDIIRRAVSGLRDEADRLEALLRESAANDAPAVPEPAPAVAPPLALQPADRVIPAPPNPAGGLVDEGAFFAALRASEVVLGPRLTPDQVRGTKALLMIGAGRLPLGWMAYVLGTAYHESGHVMIAVREKGSGRDADRDGLDDYLERYDTGPLAERLGNTPEADGDGVRYAGMGPVQITGLDNYRRATKRLRELGILRPDESLVETPELALDLVVGAAICVFGMLEGWFTTKRLNDYVPATGTLQHFTNARRIVNGTDKAALIGGYAVAFQAALQAGGWR